MALIPINDTLNELATILPEFGLALMVSGIDFGRTLTPPEILMEKFLRGGLNADTLTTNILNRFKEIGIPSGPLVNGATNVMEGYTLIMIEEIVSAIQNHMRVDIAINPGGMIQTMGANAGGPVVSVGSTINIQTGVGIAK